jgi:hypothetical protein
MVEQPAVDRHGGRGNRQVHLLCAICHRQIHAELQLLQVTAGEKPGEFKETFLQRNAVEDGNPERSQPKGRGRLERAETRG